MEWQTVFHRGFVRAGRAFSCESAPARRMVLFPLPTFAAAESYGLDIFPSLTA
jgi:hypothetical protein